MSTANVIVLPFLNDDSGISWGVYPVYVICSFGSDGMLIQSLISQAPSKSVAAPHWKPPAFLASGMMTCALISGSLLLSKTVPRLGPAIFVLDELSVGVVAVVFDEEVEFERSVTTEELLVNVDASTVCGV